MRDKVYGIVVDRTSNMYDEVLTRHELEEHNEVFRSRDDAMKRCVELLGAERDLAWEGSGWECTKPEIVVRDDCNCVEVDLIDIQIAYFVVELEVK